MARRRGVSIRLWQTGLFVVVIVVAILVLSGFLSAGLTVILSARAEASESRNAAALARRLEPEFPVTVESLERIRSVIAEYRGIYGGGIWIYDRDGTLLDAAYETAPDAKALEAARVGGLADREPYTAIELRPLGWVIAARAVHGPAGEREGVIVTASSVAPWITILDAVRSRLWTTFWVSLLVAGLVGFGFSQLISHRIQIMSAAAAAIADGDFGQRLPLGFVPDEIRDLGESYNRMAERLGQAFQAMRESERRIAAVIESMGEGVLALDHEGVVRVMNPEAARLLGTDPDAAIGTSIETLAPEPAILDVVHRGLSGERATATVTLRDRIVLLHCTPLTGTDAEVHDDTAAPSGAVLILADVTERHRIEEAQRRFIADASHEMRTPVAALKGMLELLMDGAVDDPKVRDDFLRTMADETDRLGRLVSDLLTLAQLEAGSLELKLAPVDAGELLRAVAQVMQTLAEQAGVRLLVEAPPAGTRVLADRDKAVQVLVSFTDNALKHAPPATAVTLRARSDDGGVVFEVTDEGPGIEAHERERIFERFYRVGTTRAKRPGAGLGLAIAKEIIEAHGSSITVESTRGKGTTFGFRLEGV